MTRLGVTLSDIGPGLSWPDFRDFVTNLPPTADSALYRARMPESWWWTPELDFLGAVVNAVQWGNWQRGGGRGDKPKQPTRPMERPTRVQADPVTPDELKARKQALKEQMERAQRGD